MTMNMKSFRNVIVSFTILFFLCNIHQGKAAGDDFDDGDELPRNFFTLDVTEVDRSWPIRLGMRYWETDGERYEILFKSLGPVLNLGHWSALWGVSPSAPAPHEATDERMDLWLNSIYRNLQGKESIKELGDVLTNNSIEFVACSHDAPEAYVLSYQQKEYRAKKKAEEEGREPEHGKSYYNSLDLDRLDDLAKFFAASVDAMNNFSIPIPFLELLDKPDRKGHDAIYIAPSNYTELIKKTRQQLDARNLTEDRAKLVGIGCDSIYNIRSYIRNLANDEEAYNALYGYTVHMKDNGNSLIVLQREASRLRYEIKDGTPASKTPKPVIVTDFSYDGPKVVEYHGMSFSGDLKKCYESRYRKTNHEKLTDSLCLSPWFAVRMLAGMTIQMSHGLPWLVYNQGADQWWSQECNGLIDKDNRPKPILAAFETLFPLLTNKSYPLTKQWENYDDCYIAAFRSDKKKKTRIVITITNVSPETCDRSFSMQGIDLWDIRKARVITYNNGTVGIDAEKAYQQLISTKELKYDVYDYDDGVRSDSDIEFDLTVGPHASATVVIDAKGVKKRKLKKGSLEVEVHTEL